MFELEKTLIEIDTYLKRGLRLEAQTALVNILATPVKIPRKHHVKLAEFLRRSGMAKESLKLLFKWVRGNGRKVNQSTTQEKEEYAGALIALRATEEAEAMLTNMIQYNSPKTFFFLAMASINKWNYTKAIEYLTVYLSSDSISDYDRAIGLVNLMASEVAESEEVINRKLEQRIEDLIIEFNGKDYRVLYSNLLEIKTQLVLKISQTHKSSTNLARAKNIINDPKSKENLFIQKWHLISIKPGAGAKKIHIDNWIYEINNLKRKAIEINHGETLRDIDFHKASFQDDLVEKIYFGTPYEAYRSRVRKEFNFNAPAAYWWDLSTSAKKYEFDYLKYKNLKPGSLSLRLLMALTKDFYRRMNMFTLFSLVFVDDFYNPESSFNKLHQLLNRTRTWLTENKIPLEIVEFGGEYFLKGDVSIKIYLSDVEKEKFGDEEVHHMVNIIKNEWEQKVFSIHELVVKGKFTNVRKAQRLLEKAIRLNYIDKMGRGKNTLYYLL